MSTLISNHIQDRRQQQRRQYHERRDQVRFADDQGDRRRQCRRRIDRGQN
ncbi:hypothetical protein [uncultured Ferrimonas sp.]|nr:hypothetical protein [uncultured Ferrimonas sp.]